MTVKREQKRLGRFIKSTDARLLDSISLFKFSFEEIYDGPLSVRDNPGANIIRHRQHLKEDLELLVLDPEGMNKDLRDEDSKLPIIQPVDFTIEWKKQRTKSSGKSIRLEDDEDLEIDDTGALVQKTSTLNIKRMTEENEANADDIPFVPLHSKPADNSRIPNSDTLEKISFEAQKNSIDAVGKAILNINQAPLDEELENQSSNLTMNSSFEEQNIDSQLQPSIETSPEKTLVEDYKREQRSSASQFSEEAAQQILEQYKQKGYQDGFSAGEEKAVVQLKNQISPILENLNFIVQELSGLKKKVLTDSQENFYEITQALAEALLRREFKISPETFMGIVQQAVQDAVGEDKISIFVHPQTFDALQKIKDHNFLSKLQRDEKVIPGDFRVESTKGIVDGNLNKLVKQLLEQTDAKIVDETSTEDQLKAS